MGLKVCLEYSKVWRHLYYSRFHPESWDSPGPTQPSASRSWRRRPHRHPRYRRGHPGSVCKSPRLKQDTSQHKVKCWMYCSCLRCWWMSDVLFMFHVWIVSCLVSECCKCCPHLCLIVTDGPSWCCTRAPRTPPTASSSSPADTARCRESTNCFKCNIPLIVVGFKVSFEGIENYFVKGRELKYIDIIISIWLLEHCGTGQSKVLTGWHPYYLLFHTTCAALSLCTCCSRLDLSWKAALFLRDLDIPPPWGRGPGDSWLLSCPPRLSRLSDLLSSSSSSRNVSSSSTISWG